MAQEEAGSEGGVTPMAMLKLDWLQGPLLQGVAGTGGLKVAIIRADEYCRQLSCFAELTLQPLLT